MKGNITQKFNFKKRYHKNLLANLNAPYFRRVNSSAWNLLKIKNHAVFNATGAAVSATKGRGKRANRHAVKINKYRGV